MSERGMTIRVPVLARVEGEGALDLHIADGRITDLQLRIFEPPRYFEKFLEGRAFHEIPDMVARICGICPVAYQMSASHALEQAFGCAPGSWVRAMRRLMYCGEWIESHALHIHLLAAPDFLGFPNVVEMAARYPAEVRRGLKLQALGNELIAFLGARSVHPVGVRVGGFAHAPSAEEAARLGEKLKQALPEAEALLAWTAALPLPTDHQAFTSVALRHPDEYPLNEGRIVSSAGLDIASDDYAAHFEETHRPHSTALYSLLHGQPYLVGPLARLNLNLDRMPPAVRDALTRTGIAFPSANLFHSVVARAAELYYSLYHAIELLDAYRMPTTPQAIPTPRAGVGYGCTEAPRGILWHRYEVDESGLIRSARIVPPTSQNQARIEEDLRLHLSAYGLTRSEAELRLRAEMVIRNYDPCISCATHFLTLRINPRLDLPARATRAKSRSDRPG